MPRAPEHPSGAKENTTIKLSPWHLARLHQAAETKQMSASQVVAWLLERLKLPGDTP
jgi:hypothetical protein